MSIFPTQGFPGDLIFSFRVPSPRPPRRKSGTRSLRSVRTVNGQVLAMSASQSAEPRRAYLLTGQSRGVRPRRTRNPIITSTAAFNVATRGNENNFFGCPHHKHEVLATVVGLPHAEQTFTCLMESVLSWKVAAKRVIGGNVALNDGGPYCRQRRRAALQAAWSNSPSKSSPRASFVILSRPEGALAP